MRHHHTAAGLVACGLAVSAAGCGPDRKKHDDPPLPATRLSIAAAPTDFREGKPATFSIVAVDTSGATAAFDGTIAVVSNGPVSPVSVSMADGEASADLTFQLGGDGFVRFTSMGLTSAQQYVLVRPPIPVRIPGADPFGAVLSEGSGWDSGGAWSPAAIVSGGDVRLYYASSSGAAIANIGVAVATDGLTFAKNPLPIVGPTAAASACHANGADHPGVFGSDGAWVMLYEGRSAAGSHLCRATSVDGIAWTPVAGSGPDGSVLTVSTAAEVVDNVSVQGPEVATMDDGTFRMLYGAHGIGEFYDIANGPDDIGGLVGATSPDGVTWTKAYGPQAGGAIQFGVSGFPKLTTEWQFFSVVDPAIERVGPAFHVWTSGFGYENVWRIGRFSSLDLFNLGPHVDGDSDTGEVLGPGTAGDFDDEGVLQPALVPYPAGAHRLFYTGIRAADGKRRIGAAAY